MVQDRTRLAAGERGFKMLRATTIVRKPAVRAEKVVDTIALDHEGRSRNRGTLTAEGGLAFALDLDRETTIGDGDALRLEDGRLVQVRAAPQRLLAVRAENPLRLMKLAYQLGNRHGPAEVTADAIYVQEDPEVAELARGQGCIAEAVTRPFQPERLVAAHDCGHDHGHHHHHHHGHDHAHHDHAHAHHDHGAGCGCGHRHDHKHGR
jgi:urease accessory protein